MASCKQYCQGQNWLSRSVSHLLRVDRALCGRMLPRTVSTRARRWPDSRRL
jgi:hypothetical protein